MAKALREDGLQVSQLVRQAIRSEYEKRRPRKKPLDVEAILAELDRRHPIPADYKGPGYNVHDRREARAAIVARLKRKASIPKRKAS